MPKLREYVQGPGHDISFSSLKPVATVPTPGCQYSGGQLVKLKLDATSGQQTRQVRSLMSHKVGLNDYQ